MSEVGKYSKFARNIFILLVLHLCSCATLQEAFANAEKPSVKITKVQFQNISLQQLDLLFDIDIQNPYQVPLPLTNLQYDLSSQGKSFLSGNAELQGTIPARQTKTQQIPVSVTFAGILNVIQQAKPGGVIPYTAKLGLSVDAPAIGVLTLPIEHSGEIPIPSAPSVSLQTIEWQQLTFSKATAILKVAVINNNQFPVTMNNFEYSLNLADKPIIENQISKPNQFASGQQQLLEIPISLLPTNLGFTAFRMLSGEQASYQMKGAMKLSTTFGDMDIPFDSSGDTKFKK